MIERYISINRLLRAIHSRCQDGMDAERIGVDGFAQGAIADYIRRDVRELHRLWPADLNRNILTDIAEKTKSANHDSFMEIVTNLLPHAEDQIDNYFASQPSGDLSTAILDLLHPVIFESSYNHFRAGRYRDAVLNAVVAVFDLVRERTGLDRDGAQLIAEAFSLENPKLVFSRLDSESGKNDQKGFIQILQGAYLGIRNPKAHSLSTDLDQVKAAQYLVFASLLARRVDEAKPPRSAA